MLANTALFAGLQPHAVDAVSGRIRTVDFPSRHVFFTEGEPGDCLYVIVSGKVKIGSRAPGGARQLLSVMGPSEMFGELSLFDPGPRNSTATALTRVSAAVMDRDALREWLADRPEITQRLLRVLARRLRRIDDHLSDLIFTDVAGRVAKELLSLAQRFGVQEGPALRVTHDLTQAELAQMVGATRETVNKALTDFSQRGWIRLAGKSVLVMDSERLANRAR